jgi:ABC-type multidrug transport system ATPase subunit
VSRPIFSFANIEVRYGAHLVLAAVSGQVGAGEILLVTGRNGSGKSTLLRCLAGLQRPRRGSIDHNATPDNGGEGNGVRTSGLRGDRRIAWLAPDLAFYAELSVAENLALFRTLRRLPPGDDGDLVQQLGLPPHRRAGALSSGMLQRLRWLWVLQGHPDVLLLDEPFQNLDAAGVEALSALLAERLRTGAGAIVATPSPLVLPDVPIRGLELA